MRPPPGGTAAPHPDGEGEGIMTTPNYTGSTGAQGDTGAKEQAKQAAGTAADEGMHVAGVAKDEAHQVAQDAKAQAQNLMDGAKTQIDEQSRTQRDKLVTTLQTFSDDLERMASGQGGGSGMATDMARQLADRTRRVGSHLEGREPAELLQDVRDFARRKPGTFLLGALAAGVVAGRLTRGAKQASSQQDTSGPRVGSVYDEAAGTATGDPLAGTGYPAEDPVYPAGTTDVTPTTVTGAADQPLAGGPARRGV